LSSERNLLDYMIINQQTIKAMPQQYRVAFINSLAGFRQTVLVGTISQAGHSNLAIFNSLIHLGANPALFGLISRPDVVPRDTLSNIMTTKDFTFNFVSTADYEKAHQTSARYEPEVSEFEEVGFQKEFIPELNSPFVKEAIVKIGMKFEQTIDIKINGTILIIGSIQYVQLADELVNEDGFIALEKANVLTSCGLDAYYTTKSLGRLTYAKPNTWPKRIV